MTILKNILELGKSLKYNTALVDVFNTYLRYKENFKAPYRPKSFYSLQTAQDHIAAFYVDDLAYHVPYLLMEPALNLDLNEKLVFAKRYKYDCLSGCGSKKSFEDKAPQSLIDFYKFAATCKDAPLSNREKFDVLEQLLLLSEGREKQIILDTLQNGANDFHLRHKLAHLAIHSVDSELQEKGNAFLLHYHQDIDNDAQDRFSKLPIHTRMGIPALRQKDASGKGVTVAVCDMGFFKILPQETYMSDLIKEYAFDEKSYQWKMLHQKRILEPRIFDEGWLAAIKNNKMPYHGSEMIDHVMTIAPLAQIIPVAVDSDSSKSVSEALNNLAKDTNVNIISCSFCFPDTSGLFDPEVKKSLLECLKNNKIVVLGAGNHGAFIPADLSEPETGMAVQVQEAWDFSDMCYLGAMQRKPRVITSLFEGEDETSPLFSNLLLVGSSKANSLEVYEKSVKPGHGPAQKCFVYADADEIKTFFDDEPCWGGTSAATAMVSGILADLWNQVQNPDEKTAVRVVRALRENTDIDEKLPLHVRGLGKVNGEKALKNLEQ
jgi:hypothetical protein